MEKPGYLGAVLLCCTLCLVIATVTAGHETGDCKVRFEDTGVCASSGIEPVTRYCRGNRFIKIQPCYCMYYDPTQNLSVVGHCYYSCYRFSGTGIEIVSSTNFNSEICSVYREYQIYLHRTGRFCGRCKDTYGLAAYSYTLSCIPCQDYGYKNWLRYFAVAFLPLTVFYILAVLLRFNVTSSSLNVPVLVIQCILSPVQVTIAWNSPYTNPHVMPNILKVATSIFCMANLDFFRLVYPPFCLHPDASIFQLLSLDYLVALYPFLLIFMTYVLVTVYDRQYCLVVWLWRPVQMCVHRYRNTWNIRSSLIEIFATFILFSYVKIVDVSYQILSFTATYDVFGNRLGQYYAYYDSTIEYFGPSHLPYAVLAIAVSFVFVILPLLLLAVYPCRCFQKCLNYCGVRSQVLYVFMDAFQGSYRTHPRDLRYFSAFYLIFRVLILMQTQIFSNRFMFFSSGILSLLAAALVSMFQPYKVKAHNTIDSVLFTLMGIYFVSYYSQISELASDEIRSMNASIVVQSLAVICLLLYFLSLLVWKLLGRKLQAVARKARVLWSSRAHHRLMEHDRGEDIEPFDSVLDDGERN